MTQDLDYYFPIKTETACQSKWSWSTIWLNSGTSSSCHRVDDFKIPEDNFGSFHNLPEKIVHREKMLKGEWPGQGCEYCKVIEDAGGFSDRMHNNDLPGYAPTELKDDQTLTNVKPTIVEIFAHNTCNFKCTYCGPALSSRIEQESRSFGDHALFSPVIDLNNAVVDKRYEDFFVWLEDNIQGLMRLHLLGGETFIQHDLITRVLDLVERKPCPNLQLNIFSNFNPPQKYFKKYINAIYELWKKGCIGRFDLTASIDCWGPHAEYVRFGLNCTEFEENFAYAASFPEEFLFLSANQTVSSLTMKTMPDLIRMINKYNTNRHIGHYAMLVDGYPFMRPEIFAYEIWEPVWKEIFKELKTDTFEQQETVKIFTGLQDVMQTNTENNYNEIKKLHRYHDEIDRRRNTSWRTLWPELVIEKT